MVERHKGKIIACIVVAIFLLWRYGYVQKGDIKSIVTDTKDLIHEFRGFVDDIFSKEQHEKTDTTKHKEK